MVFSIKRVMNADSYIIKTKREGVMVLTIDDLKSQQFSLELLLEARDYGNFPDSLQFQVTSSHIVIATTQNEKIREEKWKRGLKVMKVKIADV